MFLHWLCNWINSTSDQLSLMPSLHPDHVANLCVGKRQKMLTQVSVIIINPSCAWTVTEMIWNSLLLSICWILKSQWWVFLKIIFWGTKHLSLFCLLQNPESSEYFPVPHLVTVRPSSLSHSTWNQNSSISNWVICASKGAIVSLWCCRCFNSKELGGQIY